MCGSFSNSQWIYGVRDFVAPQTMFAFLFLGDQCPRQHTLLQKWYPRRNRRNIHPISDQNGKIYTLFHTRNAAHTYRAYIWEYPPPPPPGASPSPSPGAVVCSHMWTPSRVCRRDWDWSQCPVPPAGVWGELAVSWWRSDDTGMFAPNGKSFSTQEGDGDCQPAVNDLSKEEPDNEGGSHSSFTYRELGVAVEDSGQTCPTCGGTGRLNKGEYELLFRLCLISTSGFVIAGILLVAGVQPVVRVDVQMNVSTLEWKVTNVCVLQGKGADNVSGNVHYCLPWTLFGLLGSARCCVRLVSLKVEWLFYSQERWIH